MTTEQFVIIDMDLEDGTAHCFDYAYSEWSEAVLAILEETGMTNEKDIATLENEGYAESGNRKFYIETVQIYIQTTQEIEDDYCSMMYGVDNNQ